MVWASNRRAGDKVSAVVFIVCLSFNVVLEPWYVGSLKQALACFMLEMEGQSMSPRFMLPRTVV